MPAFLLRFVAEQNENVGRVCASSGDDATSMYVRHQVLHVQIKNQSRLWGSVQQQHHTYGALPRQCLHKGKNQGKRYEVEGHFSECNSAQYQISPNLTYGTVCLQLITVNTT